MEKFFKVMETGVESDGIGLELNEKLEKVMEKFLKVKETGTESDRI